jgi:hypothetical protein
LLLKCGFADPERRRPIAKNATRLLVSPDERRVIDAIAAAVRRGRMVAAFEAVAWGAAASAISPAAGGLVAAAVAVWRWRATGRTRVVRALERACPDSRNLFVTSDEIAAGRLAAAPSARPRVFADAAAMADRLDVRTVFPLARVRRAAVLAAVAWTLVFTAPLWRGPLTRARSAARSPEPSSRTAQSPPKIHVSVTVQPPAYTGEAPSTIVDPPQIHGVEGSEVSLAIQSAGNRVVVEREGSSHALERGPDGRFADRAKLTKTGYLLVTADDGARRLMSVVVSPDALPAVRVTAPGRDLIYAGGNPRIVFDATATDDYGLRSLSLRYTKVSGSGENFEFQEGEIPLEVTRTDARDWKGRASRSLGDLALKDGDMLVYRAVAADARPGDGSASSDAFFIEISKLGVAAGDAFTLPEEETRYALSQQMLIIKTERLHQRRGSLGQSEWTEQALNLAVEQRMIRAELVFMLGGAVEDEEVEAAQSTELQEGRLQNSGQRDLRAATVAMSRAEKLLTGASTAEALLAERAAVVALQRAFSRDRYILRALATRSQLDPARRLTGNLTEAGDWRRAVPDVPANRRAALLQDLLRGIAELGQSGPAATWEQRARLLAEEAVRIDPAAAPLRDAATELQRAADGAARVRALRTAAAAVTVEARRAHADAPFNAPAVAPGLAGAFSDRVLSGRPGASGSSRASARDDKLRRPW